MEEHANTLNRRDAVRHLVTGATAIAGGGLITGSAAMAIAAQAPAQQAAQAWDMTWREKLTKAHRCVFDCAEYAGGIVFRHATNWINGNAAALGTTDADLNVVLVIRHNAVAMVLPHEIWEKIGISVTDQTPEDGVPGGGRSGGAAAADTTRAAQPAAQQSPRRNPYITAPSTGGNTPRAGQLDGLIARGAIVLACNLALGQQASRLRTRAGIATQAEAVQQIRAAVIPGVYVMPNGIFAAGAAQEAGCQFFKSS